MRGPDDSSDEMRRMLLDEGTADRLLTGGVDPDDAPPAYAIAARILRAAAAPASQDELVGFDEAIAAFAELARADSSSTPSPRPWRSSVRMRTRTRTKVSGLIVVGTLLGTSGLAAAGVLPSAVQGVASDMLSKLGVSVPTGEDRPASTGSTISGIATSDEFTGRAKGEAVSTAASGGRSRAGEAPGADDRHRPSGGTSDHDGSEPSENQGSGSAPVDTPNPGGTGTAGSASGGASSVGTEAADEASQGRSSNGSGNAQQDPPALDPPAADDGSPSDGGHGNQG